MSAQISSPRRRWRIRPERARAGGAPTAMSIGEEIAERVRRGYLRAVIDPAADDESGTSPGGDQAGKTNRKPANW